MHGENGVFGNGLSTTTGYIRIGPGYIPRRTTRQSRRNSETFFGIPRPVKSAVPHLYAFRILLTEPVDIWNRPNSLAISFLPRPSKCCWMTFALTAEHIAMTTIISRDVPHTGNFILNPCRVTRRGFYINLMTNITKWDSSSCLLSNKYYDNLHMYTHKIDFISLSIIGVAAVLMVVTAPTFEQALAVSQPVVKKVSVKDPPSKVKKDPPRRFVKRCGFFRGKHICRWVPRFFRGPIWRFR